MRRPRSRLKCIANTFIGTMRRNIENSKSNYAYLFEPHEYYAQAAVYSIIKEGLRLKHKKQEPHAPQYIGEPFDGDTFANLAAVVAGKKSCAHWRFL